MYVVAIGMFGLHSSEVIMRRSTRNAVIASASGLLILSGCGEKQNVKDTKANQLVEVATSEYQWTGVAVSREGRIFVNYPRWSRAIPMSVGEVAPSCEVEPYPDGEWNEWEAGVSVGDHFVCVQSVYIDDDDDLWILDAASPMLQGVVAGGPKLVRIDLTRDEVVQTILFDSTIAGPSSYLNDVRVDTETKTAYITDSGAGAIIVVDLATRESRRLLGDHFSTMAEKVTLTIAGNPLPIKVHSDGIALDAEGEWLYYQALTGRNLYRISTRKLRDPLIAADELPAFVEHIGESGASDGLLFADGYVYLTSIEHNAIRRVDQGGEVETVVQDSLLEWPDSFSRGPGGTIYVTTSRIGYPPHEQPYRLFKFVPSL
jgi:sugar lactone lactonase YvrE